MAVVAHYGTFDVENFGDLLFPAILERRLGDLGHQFVHVSPLGGPPVWGDCVPTLGVDAFTDAPPELAGVVVGGGHIIHASPTSLNRYDQGGLSALLAYPSLWLGAAYIAAQQDVPYCWNAPGVPQPFSPAGSRLVEWTASIADYFAVRDRASRARLIDAGVTRLIRVVPDTALETPRLWSQEELDHAFMDAFVSRGREIPERVIVIHLNQRYTGEDFGALASRLDRIAERLAATPILIAMGPCHGDDQLQREVAQLMASEPLVIDRPRSLREVVACIARAKAYLGSSLHGMVVSCSFGTPGMVVVPRSAGTIGKFVGFLEQFQLTQWLAESWEATEERLDELITAPLEPWTRVLDIASPLLDEHWRHLRQALDRQSGSPQRSFVPVAKEEAIGRLAQLSGSAASGATLYAPIVAEQAILANQHRRAASDERKEKDIAVAEQLRLRAALDAVQATIDEMRQSLEEMRLARDRLHAEFTESKAQLQAEIAAERETAVAERTEKEQLLGERERLRTALEQERSQNERLRGEFDALQALAASERALQDNLRTELDRLQTELTREQERGQSQVDELRLAVAQERDQKETLLAGRAGFLEEIETLRAAFEAERNSHDQARRESDRHLAELLALRTEQETNQRAYDALLQDREHASEEIETLRAEAEANQQAHDVLRQERDRVSEEIETLRAALAVERNAHDQAKLDHERLLAEMTSLRTETETNQRAHDVLLQERERVVADVIGERDALQNVLAIEREQQAKFAAELDALRTALTEEKTGVERARAAVEQLLAEAERQSLEKTRAQADQERLLRELAQLQSTVDDSLSRERETAGVLFEAGRQLGHVNALLEHVRGRIPGKGKSVNGKRELNVAKQGLFRVRDQLGKLRLESYQSEEIRYQPLPYDPNRILPGRPETRSHAAGPTTDPIPHPPDLHHPADEHPPAGNGKVEAAVVAVGSRADIIVCVHDALDDVERCLESVVRHTADRHRVIVVDDGSDALTAAYLRAFQHAHPHSMLLRNEQPLGYTKAANRGLQAATAELMVLLNSDTIVSPNWLEHMLECAQSDPKIGIVGPLSNAASYQSVPERSDRNGDWALNPAPPGWSIDDIAFAVEKISVRTFPRVPFVNGFCFAVTRAAVEAIGFFDEAGFPDGYGEENDYCLRAANAGFDLAIADQAYVFHAKSRSYSHERRRELGKAGRGVLVRKHGIERLEAGEAWLRNEPDLARMRQALGAHLQAAKPAHGTLSVLFLLPVSGGGGGAHSVVQEASGMRRLGINAQVAIRALHLSRYRESYPAVGDSERLFFAYRTVDELQAHAAQFSVVVATIHTSMPLLATIAAEHPTVVAAYYIQDYEPFFYAEGSAEREEALRSYNLVPTAVFFAKTRWLGETVGALHDVVVHKVSPSLDHDVYFPPATKRRDDPVRVSAMIRPSSARRGAGRTMEVLERLSKTFGKRVDVQIFGCSDADLAATGLPLDFPFTNHGVLTREAVAASLRESDVFLDLSDYQAFGRTGLEAMACGCAVVVPALGGTAEYAVHGENALVVDTSLTEMCYEAAEALVEHGEARERLQAAAVAKAAEYSIERAARSELAIFADALSVRRTDHVHHVDPHERSIAGSVSRYV